MQKRDARRSILDQGTRPLRFACLLLSLWSVSMLPDEAMAQTVTWIDTLAGKNVAAADVSSDGSVVVGTYLPPGSDSVSISHAFRWTATGGFQDLGTLGGPSASSVATGVSDDGSVVVGYTNISLTDTRAFRWTAGGGMQDLGTLSSFDGSYANDVSADGSVIVGRATNVNDYRAVRWSGAAQDIGGPLSQAAAVNVDGSVIVGTVRIDSSISPFRWAGGSAQNLGTLPESNYAIATGVSDDGSIVIGSGYTYTPITGGEYGFVWEGGAMRKLEPLPGDLYTSATAMSGNGAVIYGGSSDGDIGRTVQWTASFGTEDMNLLYGSILGGGTIDRPAAASSDGRYVVGYGYNASTGRAASYLLDTEGAFRILKPRLGDKFISGTIDTITWTKGPAGETLGIWASRDDGASYTKIGTAAADAGQFLWRIPEWYITTGGRVKIRGEQNSVWTSVSGRFKFKPYLLTRLNPDGSYYEYRKVRDQWGFMNSPADMWPPDWFGQFAYWGVDPFTQLPYSQAQATRAMFAAANSADFPDWVSWVNAFSVAACYQNATLGIYNATAVSKWRASASGWNGSCFGIAATNALAFRYPQAFHSAFPSFPALSPPAVVTSDAGVKRIANELFTHQFGTLSLANDVVGKPKTPSQTVTELKQMLLEDEAPIRTLTIFDNGTRSGAHTILPYWLRQDTVQNNLYYIYVYDNSNPTSDVPITVDLSAFGGNGSWSTPDWPGWGGSNRMYLEIPSVSYFQNATLPASPALAPTARKQQGASSQRTTASQSAFNVADDVLEIYFTAGSPIAIADDVGRTTSYRDGYVAEQIPEVIPIVAKNGNQTPPMGYMLPKARYSVLLNEFSRDTAEVFFFTGNKTYSYWRAGADSGQTDRLTFDGGTTLTEGAVSMVNPDDVTKTLSLLVIVNESSQEKLCAIRSLDLAKDDSIRIETLDSSTVKLSSFGPSPRSYDIELNYATANGLGLFGSSFVPLAANSSHTIVPAWTTLEGSTLEIQEDIGNDGSVDGIFYLSNEMTDVNERGSLAVPSTFMLGQNYPNPFNPSTTISYALPQACVVRLAVYDMLGREVSILFDGEKLAGIHTQTWDVRESGGRALSSGTYILRLDAVGSSGEKLFTASTKMTLIR